MRKFLTGLVAVTVCVACGTKGTDKNSALGTPEREKNMKELSVADVADSLFFMESSTDLEPERRGKESFDDFLFFFLADEKRQNDRIRFPLKGVDEKGKVTMVDEVAWKHAYLFAKLPYYTLLFDREEDMAFMDKLPEERVKMDCYELKDRLVRTFVFEQEEGLWWLDELNVRKLDRTKGEDFFRFYRRFATDSVFQKERLCQPLQYVTADPDDDFVVLETTIDREQWEAFRPVLPDEELWNIQYGQRCNDSSLRKIVALKGIDNGFSNLLYFQVGKEGKWELYKFEDISI